MTLEWDRCLSCLASAPHPVSTLRDGVCVPHAIHTIVPGRRPRGNARAIQHPTPLVADPPPGGWVRTFSLVAFTNRDLLYDYLPPPI